MIGASLVDALLAGDEADVLVAELRAQAPVRLLREHPQRRGEDAPAGLGEELERRVRLARVRRAEVGDDRLGLDLPVAGGRSAGSGTRSVRVAALAALSAARPLLAAAMFPAGCHGGC